MHVRPHVLAPGVRSRCRAAQRRPEPYDDDCQSLAHRRRLRPSAARAHCARRAPRAPRCCSKERRAPGSAPRRRRRSRSATCARTSGTLLAGGAVETAMAHLGPHVTRARRVRVRARAAADVCSSATRAARRGAPSSTTLCTSGTKRAAPEGVRLAARVANGCARAARRRGCLASASAISARSDGPRAPACRHRGPPPQSGSLSKNGRRSRRAGHAKDADGRTNLVARNVRRSTKPAT